MKTYRWYSIQTAFVRYKRTRDVYCREGVGKKMWTYNEKLHDEFIKRRL